MKKFNLINIKNFLFLSIFICNFFLLESCITEYQDIKIYYNENKLQLETLLDEFLRLDSINKITNYKSMILGSGNGKDYSIRLDNEDLIYFNEIDLIDTNLNEKIHSLFIKNSSNYNRLKKITEIMTKMDLRYIQWNDDDYITIYVTNTSCLRYYLNKRKPFFKEEYLIEENWYFYDDEDN